MRIMPKLRSVASSIFCLSSGAQKLGQPVPDSNFVVELNNAVSQHTQRYRPASWRFHVESGEGALRIGVSRDLER